MLRFQKTSRQELWSETNSDRESEANSAPRQRWENADHDDWVAVDAEHRPDRLDEVRVEREQRLGRTGRRVLREGLDARFARHLRTNALVHDWVRRAGFDFFAKEGYRTKTLTCVRNSRGIDVAKLVRDLRTKHHLVIDGGYGRIKGETFRLSNMGDETEETVAHLLNCLDDVLQ